MAAERTLPETIATIENRCSEDRNIEDAESIVTIEALPYQPCHSKQCARVWLFTHLRSRLKPANISRHQTEPTRRSSTSPASCLTRQSGSTL